MKTRKRKKKILVQMSKSIQDPLSYDTDLLNFVSYGNPIYIRFYYIKRTLNNDYTYILRKIYYFISKNNEKMMNLIAGSVCI